MMGQKEMKILNDLIEKEKIIIVDVVGDDRMIIEYASRKWHNTHKRQVRDHEEKFSPEKWADVKSRMYREFEVIGDKFIKPGQTKSYQGTTKETQGC